MFTKIPEKEANGTKKNIYISRMYFIFLQDTRKKLESAVKKINLV